MTLEERLRERNTETEECLQRRLEAAREELAYGEQVRTGIPWSPATTSGGRSVLRCIPVLTFIGMSSFSGLVRLDTDIFFFD